MKNSEMTSEQINRRRAEQTTEEYKAKKRDRDRKYAEENKNKLCKRCNINKRGRASVQICEECRIKELLEKGINPREKLTPEEAKRRRKERKKEKYSRNNDWINNFKKDKTCAMCGYNKHSEILHFHHTKKDKEFSISQKKDKSLDILKAEIEKCILLCPNCHNWLHCIVRKNNSSVALKK